MNDKPGFLIRVKHAIFGAPISHEEQRAAEASRFRDARTDAHLETRNARFHAGGF